MGAKGPTRKRLYVVNLATAGEDEPVSELHYSRLRRECREWGATEKDLKDLTTEELANLKRRLIQRSMGSRRAA